MDHNQIITQLEDYQCIIVEPMKPRYIITSDQLWKLRSSFHEFLVEIDALVKDANKRHSLRNAEVKTDSEMEMRKEIEFRSRLNRLDADNIQKIFDQIVKDNFLPNSAPSIAITSFISSPKFVGANVQFCELMFNHSSWFRINFIKICQEKFESILKFDKSLELERDNLIEKQRVDSVALVELIGHLSIHGLLPHRIIFSCLKQLFIGNGAYSIELFCKLSNISLDIVRAPNINDMFIVELPLHLNSKILEYKNVKQMTRKRFLLIDLFDAYQTKIVGELASGKLNS